MQHYGEYSRSSSCPFATILLDNDVLKTWMDILDEWTMSNAFIRTFFVHEKVGKMLHFMSVKLHDRPQRRCAMCQRCQMFSLEAVEVWESFTTNVWRRSMWGTKVRTLPSVL